MSHFFKQLLFANVIQIWLFMDVILSIYLDRAAIYICEKISTCLSTLFHLMKTS